LTVIGNVIEKKVAPAFFSERLNSKSLLVKRQSLSSKKLLIEVLELVLISWWVGYVSLESW